MINKQNPSGKAGQAPAETRDRGVRMRWIEGRRMTERRLSPENRTDSVVGRPYRQS